MAITAPQGVVRDVAAVTAATRVRWTYIAPSLLILWIVSMFDKSNIAIVIANPRFLGEMQLTGQTKLLGWLVGGLFIAYGIAAPVWGWTVTRYGARLTAIAGLLIWALTCFWAGASHSYGNLLASRIALGVGDAISLHQQAGERVWRGNQLHTVKSWLCQVGATAGLTCQMHLPVSLRIDPNSYGGDLCRKNVAGV